MKRIIVYTNNKNLSEYALCILRQNTIENSILLEEGFSVCRERDSTYDFIISVICENNHISLNQDILQKRFKWSKCDQAIFIQLILAKGDDLIYFRKTHFEVYFNLKSNHPTIYEFLNYIINKNREQNYKITIKGLNKIYSILQQDIIFIEKSGRNTIVNTSKHGRIETKTPMYIIEEKLNKHFYKSHKGIIININQIEEIRVAEKKIKLNKHENALLISRRCLKNLKNIFLNK